jgi:hypothetical protein
MNGKAAFQASLAAASAKSAFFRKVEMRVLTVR